MAGTFDHSDQCQANWASIAPAQFDLPAAWRALVAYFPKPGAPCGRVARAAEWYGRLSAAYRSADRHYHTLTHLSQVLLWINAARQETHEGLLIATWAAYFHDAVYDARQKDNEERSAAMSLQAANELQIPREIALPAAEWILRTKTHNPGDSTACACFLDCDLAILGAPADLYRAYAEAIRSEYAWVPDDGYRNGRNEVLTAFLNRKAIYTTPLMANELEAAARRNLENELRELRSFTSPLRGH